MLLSRLRGFVSVRQHQIPALVIAVWAGALSLHFTIRACRDLSPADAAIEVCALGVLWEASKLYFGPRALVGVLDRGQALLSRLGYLSLLALVLILMAGSIGASVVFTSRAEKRTRTAAYAAAVHAIETTAEYQALFDDVERYSERIENLQTLVRQQIADSQRTKALATDAKIAALQEDRSRISQRLAELRNSTEEVHAQLGPRGPGNGGNMNVLALGRYVHLSVAIVLELISTAACVLLHASKTTVASVLHQQDSVPLAKVNEVGPIVAPACETLAPVTAMLSPKTTYWDRYETAKSMVLSGSIRPTLHERMCAVNVSQRPQRMQKEMSSEGIIV